MTLYADILFLVNLSLNWFSLLLTSKIMKLKTSAIKLLSSAAAGALAGTVTILFSQNLAVALCEIGATFLMCSIAFKSYSLGEYIKICTCLFASGVTLGGSLTLIYSFFNKSTIDFYSQSDLSGAVFILLSFAVTVTALIFERFIFSKKNVNRGEITIEFEKKSISMPFFCDSGNFLSEPISGRAAIIVEDEILKNLLPEKFLDYDPTSNLYDVDKSIYKRMRLLPAKTVCGDSLMLGFIPDRVVLVTQRGIKEADAVIAVEKTTPGSILRKSAIVPVSIV